MEKLCHSYAFVLLLLFKFVVLHAPHALYYELEYIRRPRFVTCIYKT